MGKPRLLFVDNRVEYFVSHRLPLARAAQDAGYEIHVATLTAGEVSGIRDAGFTYHPVSETRRDGRITSELRILRNLYRLYKRLRPDIVHHITLRSVLYGSLTARYVSVPAVVNGITGLGYTFTSESARAAALRTAVTTLLRVALPHENQYLTFQNPDDHAIFERAGLIRNVPATIIKGSGVDTEYYRCDAAPDDVPVVLFPSRMLWHKGLGEFIEAVRVLRQENTAARFVLVGSTDPDNPAGVSAAQLEAWRSSGLVEWWGHRSDMRAVFASAHIVCLPSYREGVPKVLIEAASCGRPIVSADVPGCREIVRHGENGLLVPAKDSAQLADAIRVLLNDAGLRERMGRNGRELVKREFSVEHVIERTLSVYDRLLGPRTPTTSHLASTTSERH